MWLSLQAKRSRFHITDNFLPLPLSLPEDSYCCVYVHKDCLVMHSDSYITKFSAGLAGQLLTRSPFLCPTPLHKFFNCQPVLDSTLVFIFLGNQCVSFGMETGTQMQVFPL